MPAFWPTTWAVLIETWKPAFFSSATAEVFEPPMTPGTGWSAGGAPSENATTTSAPTGTSAPAAGNWPTDWPAATVLLNSSTETSCRPSEVSSVVALVESMPLRSGTAIGFLPFDTTRSTGDFSVACAPAAGACEMTVPDATSSL